MVTNRRSEHETTRRPQPVQPTSRRPARPALTIAFHPMLWRIGERAALEHEVTEVSRLAPDFRSSDGRVTGPLADPFLSRSPLEFTRDGEDVLVTPRTTSAIWLDECPLTGPTRIDAAALARGVTVALAGRVLLILHVQVEPRDATPKYGLIGESTALQRVREQITLTAMLPVPVLVRGETGTGKELVARAIHASSSRAVRPYVSLNMAALNPEIAIAELFGHTRGSFTGATHPREGYFREADGGTIFLDEIGEATPEVQATLLRVLESGEIQPIGGAGARRVDVRVIAATDALLEAAVRDGTFRLALLHRLAGYELHIPPLRQRRDDVPRLLVHFLARELRHAGHGERFDELAVDATPLLGPGLMSWLVREPWPGNVRQLANTVRQMTAAILAGEDLASLPAFAAASPPVAPPTPPRPAGDLSNEALIAAMDSHQWNVLATAKALGVSRNTLYARMERCPGIRKAAEIPAAELIAAYEDHGGDLPRMAQALRVSLRGLQMRVRALDL